MLLQAQTAEGIEVVPNEYKRGALRTDSRRSTTYTSSVSPLYPPTLRMRGVIFHGVTEDTSYEHTYGNA